MPRRRSLLLQMFAAAAVAACGGKDEGAGAVDVVAADLVGPWQGDRGTTRLEFAGDDTFVLETKAGQHVTGSWTLDGTVLSLTGGGEDAMLRALKGTFTGDVVRLRIRSKTVQFRRP
jgi:hypothetical protein